MGEPVQKLVAAVLKKTTARQQGADAVKRFRENGTRVIAYREATSICGEYAERCRERGREPEADLWDKLGGQFWQSAQRIEAKTKGIRKSAYRFEEVQVDADGYRIIEETYAERGIYLQDDEYEKVLERLDGPPDRTHAGREMYKEMLVATALRSLTERQRMCFVLVEGAGLKAQDIAEALTAVTGKPERQNNISKLLHTARKNLADVREENNPIIRKFIRKSQKEARD